MVHVYYIQMDLKTRLNQHVFLKNSGGLSITGNHNETTRKQAKTTIILAFNSFLNNFGRSVELFFDQNCILLTERVGFLVCF